MSSFWVPGVLSDVGVEVPGRVFPFDTCSTAVSPDTDGAVP